MQVLFYVDLTEENKPSVCPRAYWSGLCKAQHYPDIPSERPVPRRQLLSGHLSRQLQKPKKKKSVKYSVFVLYSTKTVSNKFLSFKLPSETVCRKSSGCCHDFFIWNHIESFSKQIVFTMKFTLPPQT